MEPDDLRLMLDAASLEWERRCSAFLNLRARSATEPEADDPQIESARAEMRRALADFFALLKQIERS